MKCPVCDQENRSMLCPRCGFDSSRDHGRYPTFGPVGPGPSASALRQKWQDWQKTVGSIPAVSEQQPELMRGKSARRVPLWLMAVSYVVVLILGIWIGTGLGGGEPDPTEPGESIGMQVPPETSVDSELWRGNILRSDEVSDVNGSGSVNEFDAEETRVFGSDYRRKQILTVTFLDTLADLPDDAWDVSEAGDGRVMAWVKPNGERYDLFIGAEGGVRAGKSCKGMFMGYVNCSSITFGDAFHTDGAEDMEQMFYWCLALKSLDLSGFDTSNVQDMKLMFYGCGVLRSLVLGDRFVTANADTENMFAVCPAGDEWGHLLN